MLHRLVAVVLVGCAVAPAPLPATPPPEPAPAAPAVVLYEPPPIDPRLPFHTECHAFSAAPPVTSTTLYEFSELAILPVRRGPRTQDRPRNGVGRSSRSLRTVIASRAAEIEDCWKHASSRGAPPTELGVSLTIEPLGSIRDLEVTGPPELAGCVKTALAPIAFSGATTRPIHLGFTIDLRAADQPAWQRPWPLHADSAAVDPRSGTVCTPVVDDGVIVEVRLPAPLAVWDRDDSRTPPVRGRAIVTPSVKVGCTAERVRGDRRSVSTSFLSNLGAYQSCFADARDRDPALAGVLTVELTFNDNGTVVNPKVVSGRGDAAFHACVVAALQEIWLTPPPLRDQAIAVRIPIKLASLPTPAPAATDPAALLAAGDPDGALAAFTARLRGPLSVHAACDARAGVVLAIAQLSPWLDDARLAKAIADLARAAERLTPASADRCIAPVADVIVTLAGAAGAPHGLALMHPWSGRLTAALPLAPFLDHGSRLLWWYAESLLATPRAFEGRALLRKLMWDPIVGAAVATALQRRGDRIESLADTCSD